MRALLLCAGYGKRLKPITNKMPKCLVEINKKPVLEHWIIKLVEMGVKEVLINVHYLAEKVENFVNSLSYPIKIKIVYEDILLGTAGTLKKNQNFFKNESILLIHTDNFSSFDSKKFVKTYKNRANNIDITMMIFDTDDPYNCGVLELSADGHVIGFYEKVKHPLPILLMVQFIFYLKM